MSRRDCLARLEAQQRTLALWGARQREASRDSDTKPVGSIGKIGAARNARFGAELGLLVLGAESIANEPGGDAERIVRRFLEYPATGIAGGTTEIQKNTVAERILGLPR